jgi:hypothetical protein
MLSNADFEATVRYRRGVDSQVVVDGMVADGFSAQEAAEAVLKVQARLTKEDRRRGMFNVFIGLLIFAAGVGITVMTLSRGSVIVYAYGAVIVGAGVALLGANQIMSAGTNSALAKQNLSDHFR